MKQKLLSKKRRRDAVRRLDGQGNGIPKAEIRSARVANMRLPIAFCDLMDRVATDTEVDELASTFSRTPTFLMLAMLNTFLSFYQHNRENRDAFTIVQGFQFRNFIFYVKNGFAVAGWFRTQKVPVARR